MKPKLIKLKGEIGMLTVKLGKFNITLSIIDVLTSQNLQGYRGT